MKLLKRTSRGAIALVAFALISQPLLADRDDHERRGRGNEHGNKHERDNNRYDDHRDRRDDSRRDDGLSVNFYFNNDHRRAIDDYYSQERRNGHCPPGLAKKGNGCQAPGQAKKWRKGSALPRDLSRDPLPYELLRRLPQPPRGHEYVGVAGDILLIAVGTSMVVDAIENLSR